MNELQLLVVDVNLLDNLYKSDRNNKSMTLEELAFSVNKPYSDEIKARCEVLEKAELVWSNNDGFRTTFRLMPKGRLLIEMAHLRKLI